MNFIGRFFCWIALPLLLLAVAFAPPVAFAQEKAVSFTAPYTVLDSSVTVATNSHVTYFVSNFPVGKAWVVGVQNIGTTDPGANSVEVASFQTSASVTNFTQNQNEFTYTWNVWQTGQGISTVNGGIVFGLYPSACTNSIDVPPANAAQCLGGVSSGEYLAFQVWNFSTTEPVTLEVTLTSGAPTTEAFAPYVSAIKSLVQPYTVNGATYPYLDRVQECSLATHFNATFTAAETLTAQTGPTFSPFGYETLCGINLSASAATTITIEQGTGTTCGTNTKVLQIIYGVGSGLVAWKAPSEAAENAIYTQTSQEQICLISSAAATVDALVFTTQ